MNLEGEKRREMNLVTELKTWAFDVEQTNELVSKNLGSKDDLFIFYVGDFSYDSTYYKDWLELIGKISDAMSRNRAGILTLKRTREEEDEFILEEWTPPVGPFIAISGKVFRTAGLFNPIFTSFKHAVADISHRAKMLSIHSVELYLPGISFGKLPVDEAEKTDLDIYREEWKSVLEGR
ncbi:MAG: hypothetical protein ABIH76_05930 [Candidatus Bathyarchaeota archaeon]